MQRFPAVGLTSQRLPLAGHTTPPVPTVSPDLPWSCNVQAPIGTMVPQNGFLQLNRTCHLQNGTVLPWSRTILSENGKSHLQNEPNIPKSRTVLSRSEIFQQQNETSHLQNGIVPTHNETCQPQNKNFLQRFEVLQPQCRAPMYADGAYLQRRRPSVQQKENLLGITSTPAEIIRQQNATGVMSMHSKNWLCNNDVSWRNPGSLNNDSVQRASSCRNKTARSIGNTYNQNYLPPFPQPAQIASGHDTVRPPFQNESALDYTKNTCMTVCRNRREESLVMHKIPKYDPNWIVQPSQQHAAALLTGEGNMTASIPTRVNPNNCNMQEKYPNLAATLLTGEGNKEASIPTRENPNNRNMQEKYPNLNKVSAHPSESIRIQMVNFDSHPAYRRMESIQPRSEFPRPSVMLRYTAQKQQGKIQVLDRTKCPMSLNIQQRPVTGEQSVTANQTIRTEHPMSFTVHQPSAISEHSVTAKEPFRIERPVSIASQQHSVINQHSVSASEFDRTERRASVFIPQQRVVNAEHSIPFSRDMQFKASLPQCTYSSSLNSVDGVKGKSYPYLENILFGSKRKTVTGKALHDTPVTSRPHTPAYSANCITSPRVSHCDSYPKSTSDLRDNQSYSSISDKDTNMSEVTPLKMKVDHIQFGKPDISRGAYTNLQCDSSQNTAKNLSVCYDAERKAMLEGYSRENSEATSTTNFSNFNKSVHTNNPENVLAVSGLKRKSCEEQEKGSKVKFEYFRKRVTVEVMGKKEKRVRRRLRNLKHGIHQTTQTKMFRKALCTKKDSDTPQDKVSSDSTCMKTHQTTQTKMFRKALCTKKDSDTPQDKVSSDSTCMKTQQIPLENSGQSESRPPPSGALEELRSYVKKITKNEVPAHVIDNALCKLSKGANQGMSADDVFKLLFSLLDLKVDVT